MAARYGREVITLSELRSHINMNCLGSNFGKEYEGKIIIVINYLPNCACAKQERLRSQ